jgi:recombination protein RecR
MNAMQRLTELFSKFPGIGSRQSKRFTYFLLTKDDEYLKELSELIINLKKQAKSCKSCSRFFIINSASPKYCSICNDPARDGSVCMVVEKDVDLENVEKTGLYKGKYFVLGGSIPVLDREPETRIRAKELIDTIEKRKKDEDLEEVILAMNVNPQGENTLQYVSKILLPLKRKHSLKISLLGRGLSTGTELEYSDSETLKNALKNRAENN